MKHALITIALVFPLCAAGQIHPQCPNGTHIEGDAQRTYACVEDVATTKKLDFAGEDNAPVHLRQPQLDQIAQVCRGAVLPADAPEREIFNRAMSRLNPVVTSAFPGIKILIIPVDNREINAWTYPGPQSSLICVPSAIIRFMGNEDELAFIVAHEAGHALDRPCMLPPGKRHTRDQQVTCESRADEIGYKLIRKAGYSPFAAAGGFGRLEMYSGDTRTGIAGWFQQMSTDHPITPARVERMRGLLIQEAQANSILPR